MLKKLFVLATAGLAIFSCKIKKDTIAKPDVLASNIDTLVKPSGDFFEYANGGWIQKNPIPGEESGWGIGYLVDEENNKRLRDISEQAAQNPGAKGSASQMTGDFWTAAMDSGAIEKEGTEKLQPWFDKINKIADVNAFLEIVTELNNIGVQALFSNQIAQDDKNSDLMSYKLSQGGLGLPDREYYFKPD